jgi:uncharacterized UPF0160 family protein
LSDFIGSYNPGWDCETPADTCYEEAVTVAKSLLEHKIDSIKGIERAETEVEEALAVNTPPILILKRFAPWKTWVINTDYQFVIYPSKRGGYNAQGVPIHEDTQQLKCGFPKEWRGLNGKELEDVSGIQGLNFCHNSGFLIAGKTQESVQYACHKALEI